MSNLATSRTLDVEIIVDTAARFITTEYASLTAAGAPSFGFRHHLPAQVFADVGGLHIRERL